MSISLEGQEIFITGSAGVLGLTYIRSMLDSGAKVIASDLPGKASDRLKDLFANEQNFYSFTLDVGDEGAIKRIFVDLLTEGLSPNVVINNAAITGEMLMGESEAFPDFAHTPLEIWERAMRINLTAPFLIARQMDRDLVGKRHMALINVASMYALNGPHHKIYEGMPFKSFAAYSASKAGIHGLSLWLAGYWADRDCTVNTIAPGAVFNGHSDEFQARVGELIMAGRMAQPKEISDAMLFLCSKNARYITGQLLAVDGGFSAW